MLDETIKKNLSQAAIDLQAAAIQMTAYLEKLEELTVFVERKTEADWEPDWEFPAHLKMPIADIFAMHEMGERRFLKYLEIYPNLADEWISTTQQQMALTTVQGLRDVFKEKIDLLMQCVTIAKIKAELPLNTEQERVRNIFYGEVHQHQGDNYNVEQATVVGPNAHVHDIKIQQVQNNEGNHIDLEKLADALSELRPELRALASDSSHDIAVVEVGAAEEAARLGNREKTLYHLRKAGEWALDIATKVGIAVAIEALKAATGLTR